MMLASKYLWYLIAILVVGCIRQARLMLRDLHDKHLAETTLRQTGSTEAMSGYADVVKARSARRWPKFKRRRRGP
jgi:hypothetical protein